MLLDDGKAFVKKHFRRRQASDALREASKP
jgi:hypothetical protein